MLNVVILALLLLAPAPQGAPANRSDDEYTRYELLAPETSSFKIVYDVTAVSPGANDTPILPSRAAVGRRQDERKHV